MIVSSFRSQRGHTPRSPQYPSLAGWNQLDTGERPRPPRPPRYPRPRRTRGQRIRHLLLWLFTILIAIPALLVALVYWSAEIPAAGTVPVNQTATITASDGTTVLAKVVPPEGNRTPVPLEKVPVHVREAVLSAEDRNFYTNPGFSPTGLLRALRDNALGRADAGGGSTITQQYVKNAFLGSERTVSRKAHELIISAKMSREWNKDEILHAYLNTIYFGRGAYGIEAAAQAYFGKPVDQLTVAEGAVLAALIRTPSGLDPQNQLPQLLQRWNYVLNGMVSMGNLAPGDRDAVTFPATIPPPVFDENIVERGPEGHIKAQVLRELSAAGISQKEIDTGALNIVTTIDPKAQQAAQAAATERLEGQPPELRTAVVSIDPRSGAVRAYYGGADGIGFDFAQAPVQTGSAFKTFAVLAALQQGIPLSRAFDSAPVHVNGVEVRNVENESCGTCPISEAFKRSLNTSFYRLTLAMNNGPKAIADAAHQAGIPHEIPGVPGKSLTEMGEDPMPSIVLGTYLVRPMDMASAYATIAGEGRYHQPYFVQRVVRGDGRVLLDRTADPKQQVGEQPPPAEQRISPDIAARAAQAMLPIADYSNGHGLSGRPSAAKTGTTQLGDSGQNKDAWMVGFTPSLSTAVWVGTELNLPIVTAGGGRIYGSGFPADIWKQTMDGALADTPVEQIGNPPPGGPAPPPPPARNEQPSGGPYDILNPPPQPQPQPQPQQPFIVIPPASEPYVPEPVPEPEPEYVPQPEPEYDPGPAPVPAPPPPPPAPPPPRVIEILPGVTVPVP
ncbi:transglycosylase domain-containing protein [Nocardia carnea]|uniref:transglycosylase domain-containing protein n=1 Tax=Nocardia carnea TaxID=37328 RepID=UPI0024545925|nr:transglycosylase domain-containing protein [Nocardia carnea]